MESHELKQINTHLDALVSGGSCYSRPKALDQLTRHIARASVSNRGFMSLTPKDVETLARSEAQPGNAELRRRMQRVFDEIVANVRAGGMVPRKTTPDNDADSWRALDYWLESATNDLAEHEKNRIRNEIEAHFDAQVEDLRGSGEDETKAEQLALDGLGSPAAANQQFTRVYLTQHESKLIRDIGRYCGIFRFPNRQESPLAWTTIGVIFLVALPLLIGSKFVDGHYLDFGMTLGAFLGMFLTYYLEKSLVRRLLSSGRRILGVATLALARTVGAFFYLALFINLVDGAAPWPSNALWFWLFAFAIVVASVGTAREYRFLLHKSVDFDDD